MRMNIVYFHNTVADGFPQHPRALHGRVGDTTLSEPGTAGRGASFFDNGMGPHYTPIYAEPPACGREDPSVKETNP